MKDYNVCLFVIGPSGMGKTTLVHSIVRRHLHDYPTGIVFIHDPMAQFGKHGCHHYPDAFAWRKAALEAKEAKQPMPRGATLGGNATDVTALVTELGGKLNREDDVRVPILYVTDETSYSTGSGSTWMGIEDNQLLSTRRHLGVGIVMCLQDAAQRTSAFLRRSTALFLFIMTERESLRVDEAMYLAPKTLANAGVTQLEPRRYLHVQMRTGIVAAPL